MSHFPDKLDESSHRLDAEPGGVRENRARELVTMDSGGGNSIGGVPA